MELLIAGMAGLGALLVLGWIGWQALQQSPTLQKKLGVDSWPLFEKPPAPPVLPVLSESEGSGSEGSGVEGSPASPEGLEPKQQGK